MLEEIGLKIAKNQIKNPTKYVFILIIITLFFLFGVPKLFNNVEPSLEKVLPQQVQEVTLMNEMRSQYGADMIYLILTADENNLVNDVRKPEVLEFIDSLSNKIRVDENIRDVRSLADLVKIRYGFIPNDYETCKETIESNPLKNLFLSNDKKTTIIQITSDTGASASIIKKVIKEIRDDINSLESSNPGLSIKMTGFNTIDKATFEIIIHDFMYITIFSFLLMLAFLIIYYKGSLRKIIFSLSVVMISLIWTLGLTGYLAITITVVTMVAAAMIMALGISYGIHLVHRYEELRLEKNKKESLKEMQSELLRALIGSSLTTSVGFLALLFGVLPAMKNLGIILAIGILITLIVSIFFVPVLMFITDKRS